MSRIQIASLNVLPRHLTSLNDARVALDNDIGQAQQVLAQRVQSARLAVDAASEDFDDLRAELRRAREDGDEENYSNIADLEDDLECAKDRLSARRDQLDRTQSAAEQAKADLSHLRDGYIRQHFQAIATIETQQRNVLSMTSIQHPDDVSAGAMPTSSPAQPPQNTPVKAATNRAQKPLPPLPNGLYWIAISDLDMPSIPSDMAFNHAPRADMAQMMDTFMTGLVPMLQADPSLNRDGLVAMDTIMGIGGNGLVSPRSLAFAWDCMIGGSDLIAVSRGSNGRFGWSSGRHRSLIAQTLGWTHVPARVLGGTRP